MAVPSNTVETYSSNNLIREDLQTALVNINPADHIFMNAIGSRNVKNTLFEWAKVTLASAGNNRAIEGDDVSNDSATLPVRCLISHRLVPRQFKHLQQPKILNHNLMQSVMQWL